MLPKPFQFDKGTILCSPPDYAHKISAPRLEDILACGDFIDRCGLLQQYFLAKRIGDRCRLIGSKDTYRWLIPFTAVERLALDFKYKKGSIEFLTGKNYNHAIFVEVIIPDTLNRFFDIIGLLKVFHYLSQPSKEWRIMPAPTRGQLNDVITLICEKLLGIENQPVGGVYEP